MPLSCFTELSLLSSGDPKPFTVTRRSNAAWLVYCDHASPQIPQSLGSLGLDDATRHQHIGWDIGAQIITERVAEKLDATAVVAGYSRLVIDCNRHIDDPACMPAVSGGIRIPGNEDLDSAGRRARINEIYMPYHEALATERQRILDEGGVPVMLAIHSCTDMWNGIFRPWEIGVSWRGDDRVAKPLLKALNEIPGLVVGDNLPYDVDPEEDFTTPEHAMRYGLAYGQIEFRQDLIGTREGAEKWADIFLEALLHIGPQPDWHRLAPELAPPLRNPTSEPARELLRIRHAMG